MRLLEPAEYRPYAQWQRAEKRIRIGKSWVNSFYLLVHLLKSCTSQWSWVPGFELVIRECSRLNSTR